MQKLLHAECLCGSTRYTVEGDAKEIALCYCDQCRRANGGAFNVAVIVERGQVRFQRNDVITEYESSAGKFRAFCQTCGSPIYSRRDDLPEVLRLRGGLIANLPATLSISRGFVEQRWPWLDQIV